MTAVSDITLGNKVSLFFLFLYASFRIRIINAASRVPRVMTDAGTFSLDVTATITCYRGKFFSCNSRNIVPCGKPKNPRKPFRKIRKNSFFLNIRGKVLRILSKTTNSTNSRYTRKYIEDHRSSLNDRNNQRILVSRDWADVKRSMTANTRSWTGPMHYLQFPISSVQRFADKARFPVTFPSHVPFLLSHF